MHQLFLRLLLLEYKYICTVSAPSRKKSETKCSGQAGKKEVLVSRKSLHPTGTTLTVNIRIIYIYI